MNKRILFFCLTRPMMSRTNPNNDSACRLALFSTFPKQPRYSTISPITTLGLRPHQLPLPAFPETTCRKVYQAAKQEAPYIIERTEKVGSRAHYRPLPPS